MKITKAREKDSKTNVTNVKKELREKTEKAVESYKKLAFKGNILDMAVGVVIGAAFTNIVNTLVSSVITPIIGILTKNVDLSNLFLSLDGNTYLTIAEAKAAGATILSYGELINAIINFLIVSFVLFIVISYVNKIKNKNLKNEEVVIKETTKTCPYCKSKIDIGAIKCPYCTSELDK